MRLVATLLSRRIENGLLPAMGSFLLLLAGSVFYWQQPDPLANLWAAIPQAIHQGEYWRLLTGILAHADFKHFLSNAALVYIFAYFLTGYFGGWAYPVVSWLGAILTEYLAILTYPPSTHLIGASGLVYLMGGQWIALYFLTARDKRFPIRAVRSLGFALMMFAPQTFEPSTSYRTHAIGLAVGLVLGTLFFLVKKDEIRSHEIYEAENPEAEEEMISGEFPEAAGAPIGHA